MEVSISRTVVLRNLIWALVIVVTLVSVAILWHTGPTVPALLGDLTRTGDANNYLAAAISFSKDGVLLDAAGRSFTLFPPGLPIIIGSLLAAGIPVSYAILAVNTVSLIVLIFFTYLIGKQLFDNPWLPLLAASILALNPSTLRVFTELWTEPLFSALVAMLVFALVHSVRMGKFSRAALAVSTVLVWGLIWLKFLGVIFALLVAFTYLATSVRRSTRERWLKTSLIVGLGLIGVVPIAIRNLALGAGAFGNREQAYITLESAVTNGVQEFGRIVVQPETSGIGGVIGVVIGLLILMGCWLAWAKRNRAEQIVGLSVVIYWGALWVSQISTHVDASIERFLIPIMGPMILISIYALREVWQVTQAILIERNQFLARRMMLILVTILALALVAGNAAKALLTSLDQASF
jgi:hypothetical protein